MWTAFCLGDSLDTVIQATGTTTHQEVRPEASTNHQISLTYTNSAWSYGHLLRISECGLSSPCPEPGYMSKHSSTYIDVLLQAIAPK